MVSQIPAYDLGYLARKLKDEIKSHPGYGYAERIMSADSPEDEAAEICIGLIKGGYLKKANLRGQPNDKI